MKTVTGLFFYLRYCSSNQIIDIGGSNDSEIVTKKVAFVCYKDLDETAEDITMLIVNLVFEYISVVFLIITLFVYWSIPDMRETQVGILFAQQNFINFC